MDQLFWSRSFVGVAQMSYSFTRQGPQREVAPCSIFAFLGITLHQPQRRPHECPIAVHREETSLRGHRPD